MTITITKKIAQEITVSVPCYKKSDYAVVRIESERCATEIHIWSEGKFSISRSGFGIEKFFEPSWQDAGEEDFNAKMSAAIVLASEISTEGTA